ncbi:hypothetical protein EDB19DRAFT_1640855, partial [Suillus lakei]
LHLHGHDTGLAMSKHPKHPTVNFYDLDTKLFGSKAKEGEWHHDVKNSLLSAKSIEGGEEIEDNKFSTWLDHVQTSSAAAMTTNTNFNVESEVDLSADGLLVVLA